jgi:hypothetical protein
MMSSSRRWTNLAGSSLLIRLGSSRLSPSGLKSTSTREGSLYELMLICLTHFVGGHKPTSEKARLVLSQRTCMGAVFDWPINLRCRI